MNFRSFDFDCLDSRNLSSFREFDDFFTRDTLRVYECEIFVWEHDDQLALEFQWDELRDDVE